MNGSLQGNFHQRVRAKLPSSWICLWHTMFNTGFSLDVVITRGSYAAFLLWSAVANPLAFRHGAAGLARHAQGTRSLRSPAAVDSLRRPHPPRAAVALSYSFA